MKNNLNDKIKIFCSDDWIDYELLDTGEGEKLERFGEYFFIRPYEEAVWKKTLGEKEWSKADGKFWSSKVGAKAGWKMKNKIPTKWEMSYKNIRFLASPTPFRHLSFFPEQASHWDFIEEKIRARISSNFSSLHPSSEYRGGTLGKLKIEKNSGSSVKFLNLFGYTGVASLFALRAGAEVTHIDASKQTLLSTKENQKISGLENMPMRILLDDAIKFIEREEKRGNKYDAIIMDPPKFGRGPKGEIWKIENDLPKLLSKVKKILSDKPIFVILTSYAIDSSSLPLGYALSEMMEGFSGAVESGELCILEKSNGRTIPLANTAVWSAK